MTEAPPSFLRPLIFGVLNVTPDSFSDGGDYDSGKVGIARAEALIEAGADVVDIGAESTRPGATPISPEVEWQRLEVLLTELQAKGLSRRVSVDTRHADTMLRVSQMGIGWINCVGALPEEEILQRLKTHNSKIGFVAMHMHGNPESMQLNPLSPSGALKRVDSFFESAMCELQEAGFQKAEILLDPGIGFGKSDAANLALMARCYRWSESLPIAIGISRKGFFKRVFGIDAPKDRDQVSKVTEVALAMAGVRMIRTHDVSGLARCLSLVGEALV